MRTNVILGVLVLAVGVALIPTMPYGYYPIMRWVVSGSCVWLALTAYRQGQEPWAWLWGVIAGIYNPIFPVHSTRDIWYIVNVATIVAAVWYGFKSSRSDRGNNNG